MIKAVRVDYRLLHGQVAVSWTSALGADCLLLVSDTVKNDTLRLNAIKLAKPSGVKVVIKNTEEAVEALKSGVTDKYKLFIICEDLVIAQKIMDATGEKSLNIGNTPFREGTKQYGIQAYIGIIGRDNRIFTDPSGRYLCGRDTGRRRTQSEDRPAAFAGRQTDWD